MKLHLSITKYPNKRKKIHTNDYRYALDILELEAMDASETAVDCPGDVDERPGTTTTASGEIATRKHDMTA